MFCSKCGRETSDGTAFCANCGASLTSGKPAKKAKWATAAAPEAKAKLDTEDWRLHGQERYLVGAKLVRKPYRQYPKNPDWDHDHCEFCWATFCYLTGPDHADHLKEGYTTLDEYRWICPGCFNDFHTMFTWEVVQDSDAA